MGIAVTDSKVGLATFVASSSYVPEGFSSFGLSSYRLSMLVGQTAQLIMGS
jgi:hypothetical protein